MITTTQDEFYISYEYQPSRGDKKMIFDLHYESDKMIGFMVDKPIGRKENMVKYQIYQIGPNRELLRPFYLERSLFKNMIMSNIYCCGEKCKEIHYLWTEDYGELICGKKKPMLIGLLFLSNFQK